MKGNTMTSLNNLYVVVFCIACLMVGCNQPQPPKAVQQGSGFRSENDRPPIRIVLVAEPDLGQAIIQRWHSASDQDLALQILSVDEFLTQSTVNAEVIVFPAFCLATAVERGWLSQLPSSLKPSETGSPVEQSDWPMHWQQMILYGKKSWGIPLGAPLPLIATEVHLPTSDEKESSGMVWGKLVERAIQNTKLPLAEASVDARIPIENSREMDTWIVDRFVMSIAGQQSSKGRIGYFFNVNDMRPKLTDPDIIRATHSFARIAIAAPTEIMMENGAAWSQVRRGDQSWAIGWPETKSLDSKNPDANLATISESALKSAEPPSHALSVRALAIDASPVAIVSAKLESQSAEEDFSNRFVDPGHGLIAALSRNSRQTAASIEFMRWMDGEDQRAVFSKLTRRISCRSLEAALAIDDRSDVESYQRWCFRAWNQRFLPLELRLSGADRYRKRLAKALVAIIRNPQSIEDELEKCSQDWELITEQFGRQKQRQSLERCLNLSE